MFRVFAPLFLSLAKTKQFKTLVLTMLDTLAKNTDNDIDDTAVRHLRQLMFPERNEAPLTCSPQ